LKELACYGVARTEGRLCCAERQERKIDEATWLCSFQGFFQLDNIQMISKSVSKSKLRALKYPANSIRSLAIFGKNIQKNAGF